MRRRNRICAGLGLALLALPGTACQSAWQGQTTSAFEVEPGRTTRDEIYRSVGPPHDVYRRRDGRDVLVYNFVRMRGMRAGVSIFFTPFQLGQSRTATDSIFIDLSRDDVVVAVRQLGGEAAPSWSIWPGGEGSAD